jgi:hypothetical protein
MREALERKEAHRRFAAALPFPEKVEKARQLRDVVAEIKEVAVRAGWRKA